MSALACVARWSTTASYGRKLVETIAWPGAWAMAQRTISSGDLAASSALSRLRSVEVMGNQSLGATVGGLTAAAAAWALASATAAAARAASGSSTRVAKSPK